MFGKVIVFRLFEMIPKKKKKKSEDHVLGSGRVEYGCTGRHKKRTCDLSK